MTDLVGGIGKAYPAVAMQSSSSSGADPSDKSLRMPSFKDITLIGSPNQILVSVISVA